MDELIAELKRSAKAQRRLARALDRHTAATFALMELLAPQQDEPDDEPSDTTLDGDD